MISQRSVCCDVNHRECHGLRAVADSFVGGRRNTMRSKFGLMVDGGKRLDADGRVHAGDDAGDVSHVS